MEILALIPARRDSVRLPGKNTMMLAGKPLIVHTIEQAKQVKNITRTIVVSDDPVCLDLARERGCGVMTEPLILSREDVPMARVMQYAVTYLDRVEGYKPPIVVLLQPTSPLRSVKDIEDCIEWAASNACDSVTTVCEGKENGAVYVFQRQLAERGLIYGPSLCRHAMPPDRSVDINYMTDFKKAEELMGGSYESVHTTSAKLEEPRKKRAYHRRK